MSLVQQPQVSFHQRSELTGSYVLVDSTLKTLKVSSKQLQTTLSNLRNEMQILERLYYKGKNQHRTALFWRRVCDVRKCGARISNSLPDTLVENFRRSFWGPPDKQNPRMLKGSWTHFPDTKFVLDVNKRLYLLRLLCNESLVRITKAFKHFSLCMQNGAFIQYMLTLYAVSARAHALVAELGDLIDVCEKASSVVINVLRVPLQREAIPEHIDLTPANGMPKLVSTDEPIGSPESTTLPPPTAPHLSCPEILFEPGTPAAIDPAHKLGKRKKVFGDSKKNRKKRKQEDEIDQIFNF